MHTNASAVFLYTRCWAKIPLVSHSFHIFGVEWETKCETKFAFFGHKKAASDASGLNCSHGYLAMLQHGMISTA